MKKRGTIGHAAVRAMLGRRQSGMRRAMSTSRAKTGRSPAGRVAAAKAGRSKKC